MKFLIAFFCFLAAASAKPQVYTYPYAYAYNNGQVTPVAYSPYAYAYNNGQVTPIAYTSPMIVTPVAHSPVVAGHQVTYGHAIQDASKVGQYSYVVPHGQVTSTNHVAVVPVVGHQVAVNQVDESDLAKRRGRRDVAAVSYHVPVVNSEYYTQVAHTPVASHTPIVSHVGTPVVSHVSSPVVSHVGTPVVSHVGTPVVSHVPVVGVPVVSGTTVVHPTAYSTVYNRRG